MISLKPLQVKYELAMVNEALNNLFTSALVEAIENPSPQPVPAVASTQSPVSSATTPTTPSAPAVTTAPVTQTPAAPAPAAAGASPSATHQPTEVTPSDPQQAAAEVDPKALPEIVDQLILSIEADPQAMAALKQAVDANDVTQIQKLVAQHLKKESVYSGTQHERVIEELVERYSKGANSEEILEGFIRYVETKGSIDVLREYDTKLDENILSVYSEVFLPEGVMGDIWQGVKNAGAWAGKQIFKWGPWAALGALAGGPMGAATVALLAKALSKVGTGHSISSSANPGSHVGEEIKTNADLSNYTVNKAYNISIDSIRSLGLTDSKIAEIKSGKPVTVSDKNGNLVVVRYDPRLNNFTAVRRDTFAAHTPDPSDLGTTTAADTSKWTPPPPPPATPPPPAASTPAAEPPVQAAPAPVAAVEPAPVKPKMPAAKFTPKLKPGDKSRFKKLASFPKKNRPILPESAFENVAKNLLKEFYDSSK